MLPPSLPSQRFSHPPSPAAASAHSRRSHPPALTPSSQSNYYLILASTGDIFFGNTKSELHFVWAFSLSPFLQPSFFPYSSSCDFDWSKPDTPTFTLFFLRQTVLFAFLLLPSLSLPPKLISTRLTGVFYFKFFAISTRTSPHTLSHAVFLVAIGLAIKLRPKKK